MSKLEYNNLFIMLHSCLINYTGFQFDKRIIFIKVLILMYKCQNDLAAVYLCKLLEKHTSHNQNVRSNS